MSRTRAATPGGTQSAKTRPVYGPLSATGVAQHAHVPRSNPWPCAHTTWPGLYLQVPKNTLVRYTLRDIQARQLEQQQQLAAAAAAAAEAEGDSPRSPRGATK